VSSALYLDEATDELILTQGTLSSIQVLPSKTLVDPKASNIQVTHQGNKLSDNSNQNQTEGVRKRKAVTAGKENDGSCVPFSKPSAVEKKILMEGEEVQTQYDERPSITSNKGHGPSKPKSKKAEKSCRKRLLTQVKGQSKITGFFRL
ncbi:hypothetical protein EGW08_021728, partial [Elysia chlorotica]